MPDGGPEYTVDDDRVHPCVMASEGKVTQNAHVRDGGRGASHRGHLCVPSGTMALPSPPQTPTVSGEKAKGTESEKSLGAKGTCSILQAAVGEVQGQAEATRSARTERGTKTKMTKATTRTMRKQLRTQQGCFSYSSHQAHQHAPRHHSLQQQPHQQPQPLPSLHPSQPHRHLHPHLRASSSETPPPPHNQQVSRKPRAYD